MMVLAHWLRIRSCIKIIHVSCTTQSEVQLGKRFSKFFLVPVKYKRLCTSRKGVYNSLVEIEQEVIFQWVKLLEISSVFCSCCFEKFSSSDICGNHQWKSPALYLFQMAICFLHNSYLNFYLFNYFQFLSFYLFGSLIFMKWQPWIWIWLLCTCIRRCCYCFSYKNMILKAN